MDQRVRIAIDDLVIWITPLNDAAGTHYYMQMFGFGGDPKRRQESGHVDVDTYAEVLSIAKERIRNKMIADVDARLDVLFDEL